MIEQEFVRRRAWLTREQFLDLVGAASLIPGPSSTEVAIYVGHRRAGWRGLVVAGLCFVMPAALMVTAIAWAYVRFGRLPAAGGALHGIRRSSSRSSPRRCSRSGARRSRTAGSSRSALWPRRPARSASRPCSCCWRQASRARPCAARPAQSAASILLPGARRLCDRPRRGPCGPDEASSSVFLKIGSVVFGSGYVLLAFLRADLVDRMHWLTEPQLLDAVAIGQVTPGPVFTTATFIGYIIGGGWGALLATAGIFLPGFLLVGLARPLIARVRRSPLASAFLDGVNVAALALMAVVTVQLGRAAARRRHHRRLPSPWPAAWCCLRWKVNSAWVVLAGGVAGAVVQWATA